MDLHNNSATSESVLSAQFLLLFRVWNVADGVSFVDMKSNNEAWRVKYVILAVFISSYIKCLFLLYKTYSGWK